MFVLSGPSADHILRDLISGFAAGDISLVLKTFVVVVCLAPVVLCLLNGEVPGGGRSSRRREPAISERKSRGPHTIYNNCSLLEHFIFRHFWFAQFDVCILFRIDNDYV